MEASLLFHVFHYKGKPVRSVFFLFATLVTHNSTWCTCFDIAKPIFLHATVVYTSSRRDARPRKEGFHQNVVTHVKCKWLKRYSTNQKTEDERQRLLQVISSIRLLSLAGDLDLHIFYVCHLAYLYCICVKKTNVLGADFYMMIRFFGELSL